MHNIESRTDYKLKQLVRFFMIYLKDDCRDLDKYVDGKTGKEGSINTLPPYMVNAYIREYCKTIDDELYNVMVMSTGFKHSMYLASMLLFIDINEVDIIDYLNYETTFISIDDALKDLLCNLSYYRTKTFLSLIDPESILFYLIKNNNKEALDKWIDVQKIVLDTRRNEDK